MKGMKSCKSSGGSAQVVSGNKNVISEAKEAKNGDEGRKRGGKVKKRKEGGKVVGRMDGGSVRPRLDRPGRKRGGGVGANLSPLSTAKNVVSSEKTP